mgnify:CR=1 FL=1
MIVDVAIDFSVPLACSAAVRHCLDKRIPLVVATTGLNTAQIAEVKEAAKSIPLCWAPSMSLAVNLTMKLAQQAARALQQVPQGVDVEIIERHHRFKEDAPSGTAITLARDIDLKTGRYSGFELVEQVEAPAQGDKVPSGPSALPVPIISERKGEVTGKHAVSWTSVNDRIVISHEAFDRSGFALGAVIAAEWLIGRQGFFNMDNVLDGK